MELWDLYNKDRVKVGTDHVRGTEIPDGCYHLVVHVWIKNSKGLYLISKRAPDRPTFPNMWECVGGSVIKGENSSEGALREVKEEVGVDLNGCEGQVVFTKTRGIIDGKKFGDIMDVWLFSYDGEVSLSKATTREVSEVKWLTREEIMTLYEKKLLVPTLEYFFDKVDTQERVTWQK